MLLHWSGTFLRYILPSGGYAKYAPLDWHLPPLNFNLGWLTKGMRRWNGTFLH